VLNFNRKFIQNLFRIDVVKNYTNRLSLPKIVVKCTCIMDHCVHIHWPWPTYPMTLTYIFDLNFLTIYLRTRTERSTSGHSKVTADTDTYQKTDRCKQADVLQLSWKVIINKRKFIWRRYKFTASGHYDTASSSSLRHPARRRSGSILSPGTDMGYDTA